MALVLLVFLAAACGPNAVTPTVTPTPVASASATASVAPSREASAVPAATAASTPTTSGVTAMGLGALSGNWIFFTRRVPNLHATAASLEVWGMPAGGAPRLAFSYSVSLGGVPEAAIDNDPYLRRQFSPDGRKVVVSTDVGLVVIDLTSGFSSRLGVGGLFPTWSKDGASIAYLATVSKPDPQIATQERSIWVVPVAGGAPRELANVGYSTTAPEWSPDGTLLLAQLKDGVGLIEVASGRVPADGRIPFAISTTGVHWRGAGQYPAIVGIVRLNDTQLVQFDPRNRRGGFPAQWARPDDPSPCRCPKGLVPSDPRWNPSGNDEVLFKLLNETTARAEASIIDLQSGTLTKAVADVGEATWSADGTQVLYIARSPSGGGALRVWDRASGADRELVPLPAGAPNGTAHLSVASVSY